MATLIVAGINMSFKAFAVFLLFTALLSSLASAESVISIVLKVKSPTEIELVDYEIVEGEPTSFTGGSYYFIIYTSKGATRTNTSDFGDVAGVKIISIPYSQEYKSVELRKGVKSILKFDVQACNFDGVCSGKENYNNCRDCTTGTLDGECDAVTDKRCDADCPAGLDRDCSCNYDENCVPPETIENCPADCAENTVTVQKGTQIKPSSVQEEKIQEETTTTAEREGMQGPVLPSQATLELAGVLLFLVLLAALFLLLRPKIEELLESRKKKEGAEKELGELPELP